MTIAAGSPTEPTFSAMNEDRTTASAMVWAIRRSVLAVTVCVTAGEAGVGTRAVAGRGVWKIRRGW
ncbi:hypothetical protein AB0I81_33130 [Nonomuraea sp. NPDC050404]|uniref:hypothetical protein n=1 Tax=Nonomuraea sp. NPDC050404 TaxID=3155783 RepID=UPI0033E4A3D2